MKIQLEMHIKPFTVPNFVIIEDDITSQRKGLKDGRSLYLSELDSIALDKMCDDFRAAIFKKAGKQQPPTNE